MHRDRPFDEAGRVRALARYDLQAGIPDEPFDKIVGLIRLVMGVPIASVTLVDEHRQWFLSEQGLGVASTPREIAFCTHTIMTPHALVIDNAREDARFRANPLVTGPPGIVAYLGAPLISPDGYAIGAVCAMDQRPRQFTRGDIAIIEEFAKIVVDSFELRQIARRDHLTGFLTRRALVEALLARIVARDLDAALIVFDIDRFKAINDRFGHVAGDEVLRAVARRCDEVAGPGACLGRLGGEEFAWLLPSAPGDEAQAAAERLRDAIATMPTAPGNPAVTASFGVAKLHQGIGSVSEWLRAADTALYAAKHAGRNCCESAAA